MGNSDEALKLNYGGVYKQGSGYFFVSSDDVASKIFKTEKEATEEFYINETKIHLKSSKVNIAKLTRIQLIEFGKKIDESIAVFRGIKN